MSFRALPVLSVIIAVTLCVTACNRVAPVGDSGGAGLMRNLMRSDALEIVAEEHELT